MNNKIYDVIIIGGGIMGCATAYFLKKADDQIKVAVVEMDPTYSRASTTLSMANARIQFSLEENIRISQFTFEVLERFEEEMAVEDHRPNIAFRREGNLFIVDDAGKDLGKRHWRCREEWAARWNGGRLKKSKNNTPFIRRRVWREERLALWTAISTHMHSSWDIEPRPDLWGRHLSKTK